MFFLIALGIQVLVSVVAILFENEDKGFEGDKLIYRS